MSDEIAPIRDEKGRLLPGQSSNRGGRPKTGAGFSRMVRTATQDGKTLVEVVVALLADKAPHVRLAAANFLANRGWGSPQQNVSVDASLERPHFDLTRLSLEQLRQLKELVAQAEPHALPAPSAQLVEPSEPLEVESDVPDAE